MAVYLAHSIRGLAFQEPAIDWWTNDNDSSTTRSTLSILVEVRETCLNAAVQAFWIDLLH